MARAPTSGVPQSNGHGRRSPGLEVVARQSNLFVESSKKVSDAELKKMLIEEVKKQGKPYGLYFDQVTGGLTTASRAGFQAVTWVSPMVHRLFSAGRAAMMRGVGIVGAPPPA